MDREALGVSFHWIRTWCQRSSKLSVYISSRCCRAWKQYMQPDIRPSGRGCVVLHVTETCSQPCGAKGAASKMSIYISSRCLRAWKQYMKSDIHAEGHLDVGLSSCSQPCGARGAAANASGAIRSNTWAATNLMLIAPREGSVQLKVNQVKISSDGKHVNVAPREGSVQLKVNQVKISSDGKQVNVAREGEKNKVVDLEYSRFSPRRPIPSNRRFYMIVTWKLFEVLKFDTPPGSPKNCPEAKGDQSCPVKTFILGFGHVLSDQPAASRLEHCELVLFEFHLEFKVLVIFKDSVVARGRTIWCFLNLVPSGFKKTHYSLDREHSERRGHGLWLSGYTDGVVTASDPTVLGLSHGDLTVPTLSPKSGLCTRFGLVCICYAISLVGRSCSCLIVGRPFNDVKSFQGQSVPLMIKWRCCPELVQFHGFRSVEVLLDTPPGSPKNCPGGKGGSPDQSVPVIFKDSVVAGGRTIWCFLNLVPSGFKETPYSMDREHSERRGLGLWLSGYTDGVVTDSDPTVRGLSRGDPTVLWAAIVVILSRMMRRNTKSPFPAVVCCVVLECRRGLWNPRVLTLSPKSGLGTGLGLVCIWLLFPLLEARSWQEAKSNLVTVALGKDDRIAGCWTLGPPV
ncbi:hypothetical protein F2Q68_00005440 [Brassica cretica]|uniref:Uncharacterized protein n=1 Tax=Brassica cretica TaxID=69181 RepID=A0A8S9JME8_BRACR|nr:hypothetical protein F2Q68_00005440 [Brassica cretica]